MFRESSTIGIRETTVAKHALERSWRTVDVDGQSIRVKVACLQGELVNASPEWEDVAAAAQVLNRPAKTVLAAATAAAHAPEEVPSTTDPTLPEPDDDGGGIGTLTAHETPPVESEPGGLGTLTPHDDVDESEADGGLGRLISRGPGPGM
jgi:hypothetical protein